MAKVLWVLVLAAIACQVRGFGPEGVKPAIHDLVSNSDDGDSSTCPDGLYNAKNCSTFIQCSNGIEHVIKCPGDLHYSTKTERCERPCDARCDRTYSCRCGWQTCDSQICFLPYKAGPCNETSERYYFDKRVAKCVKFTYGGCRGNENNFQTKKECEKSCSNSIDICRLPKVKGPCKAHMEKYFFNRKTGQCEKFVYGGCQGNPNRFDSKEACEQKCLRKMDRDIDVCRLSKEPGPCNGHIEKYFFNHQTGQCEKFVYGGCRGNSNNFDSREQCEQKCLRREDALVDICGQPKEPGPCHAIYYRFWYNRARDRCEEFIWTGCDGNSNNWNTRRACELKCAKHPAPEGSCSLPAEPGNCKARVPRYFYDKSTGKCTQFMYGGCNGNANNYETKDECEEKCGDTVDVCQLPKEVGPCQAQFRRWWYDPEAKKCEQFAYGGCRGNGNNFASESECEKRCLSSGSEAHSSLLDLDPADLAEAADIECGKDGLHPLEKNCSAFIQCTNGRPVVMPCPKGLHYSVKTSRCEQPCDARCDKALACKCNWKTCGKNTCKLPPKTGSCSKFSPRFFYDENLKQCRTFIYSGCLGNENNFVTKRDCMKHCETKKGADEDICKLPKETGNCKAYVRKYYFNTESGMCEPFVYGGCEGNENNFLSITECQRRCLKSPAVYSGAEPECDSPPEVGPCRAQNPRYYYDKKTMKCIKFIYGGCGGNGNNYETINECMAQCWKHTPGADEDICKLPKETGNCKAYVRKYYFNTESGMCEPFVYGGCEGNENNFVSITECQRRCLKSPVEEEESVALGALPEYCELPSETGPCKANITKFYYDHEEKECKEFQYGGCRGNRNSFYSKELCERKCKDEDTKEEETTAWDALPEYCELPPETGPCKANITKFYYDHEEKECKEFQYGGCRGNRNSFYSKELCERRCKDKDTKEEEESMALGALPEYCELPPETGPCKANITKFYYDHEEKECKEFQYGGCRGNRNSFYSKELCERKCKEKDTEEAELAWLLGMLEEPARGALPEYCELEPETGPCHANITKFYYDHEEEECKEFQYGGCGGNRNSFYSKEMCERKCKSKKESAEEVFEPECHSKPDVGRCKANILRWYFDEKTGDCEHFFYSGCGGNGNNYRNGIECLEKCSHLSSVDLSCQDEGDFFYRPDCSKFIRCKEGVAELKECPSGQAFDFLTKQCVDAEKARCLL